MKTKQKVEYLKELLDNVTVKIECTVCENTLKELKKEVNKEFKKKWS